MGGLEVGDARRSRRLRRRVEALSAPPLGSIPVASGGWAETQAADRRLDKPALDWREMWEVHTVRTRERMAGQPVVRCSQDSPELDFTTPPGIAGRGRLRDEAQPGRAGHPPRVVTPPGAALGVVAAGMWARAPTGAATCKERGRGREGYGRVADRAETRPATRLVSVAERAGDRRALRDDAASRGTPADWRVRAPPERKTAVGDKRWARLGASEPLGNSAFTLPAVPGRPSRWVGQTLSLQRVTRPARKGAPAVQVTARLARAAHPPAGEQAIEWRWLTKRPATTLEPAVELIEWSRRRGRVEVFGSLLKSGCRVEALQLGTLERRDRARVIYLLSAWRLLPRLTWGRDCPALSCAVGFDPEEWQAAWSGAHRRPPPDTPPPLGMMVRLLARCGGVLGRKRDGHPGPKALWQGLQRVREWALAFEAGTAAYASSG